jgi:hypothetical protein
MIITAIVPARGVRAMKKSTFDRRLRDAKNQKLIYLSPLNNEYALTSEYLKRNGTTP